MKNRFARLDAVDLREYPQVLLQLQSWSELEDVLTDLQFIEAKCSADMLSDLEADYASALSSWPGRSWRSPFDAIAPSDVPEWLLECTKAIVSGNSRAVEGHGAAAVLDRLRTLTESERTTTFKRTESRGDEHLAASSAVEDEPFGWLENVDVTKKATYSSLDENCNNGWQRVQHYANFVYRCSASLTTAPELTAIVARNYASSGSVLEQAKSATATLTCPWISRDPRDACPPLRSQILRTLPGGALSINGNGVALTPDGRKAVTYEHEGTLRIWDVRSGQPLSSLDGHIREITGIAVSADGKWVLSGDGARTIRAWDAETGTCLRTSTMDWGIRDIVLTHDGSLAIVGLDMDTEAILQYGGRGQLATKANITFPCYVWNVKTGEIIRSLKGHTKGVRAVAMTPDGLIAATLGGDEKITIWDVTTARCLRTIEDIDANSVVRISDNGRIVAVGHFSMTYVVDLATGRCLRALEGECARQLLFGGRVLITTGAKTIHIWDVVSGKCLKEIKHNHRMNSLKSTHDGSIAVTTGDARLTVWDLTSDSAVNHQDLHQECISSIAETGYGLILAGRKQGISEENTLDVLHRDDLVVERSLSLPATWKHLVPHPDERFALTVKDHTIGLYGLSDGTCIRHIQAASDSNQHLAKVAVSPDGRTVISSGADCAVRTWDLDTGTLLHYVPGVNPSDVSSRITYYLISFVKQHSTFDLPMTAAGDDELRKHPIFDGIQNEPVTCLALTPDGLLTITGTSKGFLRIWNMSNTTPSHVIAAHASAISSLAVSPDGQLVISAGQEDNVVRAYDLATATLVREFHGHQAPITCLAFSSDGKVILAGSVDGSIRAWLSASGIDVAMYLSNHGASVEQLSPGTAKALSHWWGELGIQDMTSIEPRGQFMCVDGRGTVHGLRLHNYSFDFPIVTAVRLFRLSIPGAHSQIHGEYDSKLTVRCPWCRNRSIVRHQMLDLLNKLQGTSVRTPCTELSREKWANPGLLTSCTQCGRPLKFNPFIVDDLDTFADRVTVASGSDPFPDVVQEYTDKLLQGEEDDLWRRIPASALDGLVRSLFHQADFHMKQGDSKDALQHLELLEMIAARAGRSDAHALAAAGQYMLLNQAGQQTQALTKVANLLHIYPHAKSTVDSPERLLHDSLEKAGFEVSGCSAYSLMRRIQDLQQLDCYLLNTRLPNTMLGRVAGLSVGGADEATIANGLKRIRMCLDLLQTVKERTYVPKERVEQSRFRTEDHFFDLTIDGIKTNEICPILMALITNTDEASLTPRPDEQKALADRQGAGVQFVEKLVRSGMITTVDYRDALGELYDGKLDMALIYLRREAERCEEAQYEGGLAQCLVTIGTILLQQRSLIDAIEAFQDAKEASILCHNEHILARCLRGEITALEELGDNPERIDLLRKELEKLESRYDN